MNARTKTFAAIAIVITSLTAGCSSGSDADSDTEPTSSVPEATTAESISTALQDGFSLPASRADCAADILTETLPSDSLDAFAAGEESDLSGDQSDEVADAIRDAVAECP